MSEEDDRICELPNGYYRLAKGKLINIVTWLQCTVFEPEAIAETDRFQLKPLLWSQSQIYLSLYRKIGEPLLWTSHLLLSPQDLKVLLNNSVMRTYCLYWQDEPTGLLQLNCHQQRVEVSYFGLETRVQNMGAGSWLMVQAPIF